MTEGTDVQAVPEAAPAESDTTTSETSEQPAPERETEGEGDETEASSDDGDDEDKPRRASRSERQKRALAAARAEAADLKARLEAIEQARQAPAKDDRPKEQDFNGDYAAFERAQTAYEVRQAIREERARDEQAQAAHRDAAALQAKRDAFEEAIDDIRDRLPDIDKVLNKAISDGLKIDRHVWEEILTSDKQAHLAYYLAGKPEKARALNAMSPREAAREIGRIEARLSLPTPNKSTKSPPPRTAPAGGAAAAPDPGSMSMADYIAWRNKGG